jgi:hypothetical protein
MWGFPPPPRCTIKVTPVTKGTVLNFLINDTPHCRTVRRGWDVSDTYCRTDTMILTGQSRIIRDKACPSSIYPYKTTMTGVRMNQSFVMGNLWPSSRDKAWTSDVSGSFNEKMREKNFTLNFRQKPTRKWRIWRSMRGWADKISGLYYGIQIWSSSVGFFRKKGYRNLGFVVLNFRRVLNVVFFAGVRISELQILSNHPEERVQIWVCLCYRFERLGL